METRDRFPLTSAACEAVGLELRTAFSAREVGRIFDRTGKCVRQWCLAGLLGHVKPAGLDRSPYMIRIDHVEDFLRASTTPSPTGVSRG